MPRSSECSLHELSAETFRQFDKDFCYFLLTAAQKDGHLTEDEKVRFLSTLYSLANTQELLFQIGEKAAPAEGLVCPFSASGLEFYRQRYGLNDEQWQHVSEFLRELSQAAGEEVIEHIQRVFALPCASCWMRFPLNPLHIKETPEQPLVTPPLAGH